MTKKISCPYVLNTDRKNADKYRLDHLYCISQSGICQPMWERNYYKKSLLPKNKYWVAEDNAVYVAIRHSGDTLHGGDPHGA